MADVQTVTELPKNKLSINQAFIQGKIQAKRKIKTQYGDLHLTVLRLAAHDEYSHPATVELRSDEPLGDIEETITVKVKLGGLPNNYYQKSIDRETGEEKKVAVRSARNDYTVINGN
jgi:hypothetical protein